MTEASERPLKVGRRNPVSESNCSHHTVNASSFGGQKDSTSCRCATVFQRPLESLNSIVLTYSFNLLKSSASCCMVSLRGGNCSLREQTRWNRLHAIISSPHGTMGKNGDCCILDAQTKAQGLF